MSCRDADGLDAAEDVARKAKVIPFLEDRRNVLTLQLADSGLEQRFVRWLDERGLRLPDRAQVLVPEANARPDFVYDRAGLPVAVFVDGPVHDGARQAERDRDAEDRLVDAGWEVVRVWYDDDWSAVVARHPSTFGVPARGHVRGLTRPAPTS